MTKSKSQKPGFELDALDLPKITPQQPAETPVDSDDSAPENQFQEPEIPSQPKPVLVDKTTSQAQFKPKIIIASILALSIVISLIFVFRSSFTFDRNQQNGFTMPVDRLCLKLENSSLRLHESVQEIEILSFNMGSRSKIKLIIETIGIAKNYLSEYLMNIEKLQYHTKKYQEKLSNEEQEYLIETINFFQQDEYKHYIHILTEYLDILRNYLTYYDNNFEAIKKKQQAKIKSLEVLYIKYKRISNIYNNADSINGDRIRQFIEKHPKAAKFFPIDLKGSIFKWTN